MEKLWMIPAELFIEEGAAVADELDDESKRAAVHELTGSTVAAPFRNDKGEADPAFVKGYLLGLSTSKVIYSQGGHL